MKKVYVSTYLIIALILVINLLANEFHIRLDVTEGKQYTLSEATEDILSSLEEPVTVKAYFSEDLPPNITKTRKDFQELLIEYANRADGMVQYEFINPNEKESNEREATQHGIQPVLINVREKDQVKQQKAFLGALISLNDKQEVIPFMQPGAAMEYALSTAIKKISVTEKTTLGFLQGHGEPGLNEMSQLNEQLQILYNIQPITLSDTTDFPASMKTLVIVRPTDSLQTSELQKLDGFLARGGNIAVAINRVNGDLQNAYGYVQNTGLENWLQAKGILVEPNFVVDAKCGSVTLQQQQGFFTMQSQVAFPYLPLVGSFADHPITKGLENVLFEFASSLKFVGDTSRRFNPLLYTSDKSNSFAAPQYFNVQKQWTEADLPLSGIIMGAALEGKFGSSITSKLVVIADGDFVVNGAGQQPRKLQPDNVSLLSNTIDWLSDDTGLIALRTKGVTSRPIDELEDSTKTIIKYTNFALPLLLVMVYGLVRFQYNRMQRLKRMSLNYEKD
jgi:gliding-associated putative ABC transporter substrate-binding component GldG